MQRWKEKPKHNDDGQELDSGLELGDEQNGRHRWDISRQEVNGSQRQVGDEHAIGGIRLQSRRNTCKTSSLLQKGAYAMASSGVGSTLWRR